MEENCKERKDNFREVIKPGFINEKLGLLKNVEQVRGCPLESKKKYIGN